MAEATPLFDMSPEDFGYYLRELESTGRDPEEINFLRREYRKANTAFSGKQQDYEEGLADEGRKPIWGGFASKPEGATGWDAIRGLEFEPWGGATTLGNVVVSAINTPKAAYEGSIPREDMTLEAMNTAGMFFKLPNLEINDSEAVVIPDNIEPFTGKENELDKLSTVGDILIHDELFYQYPDLVDIPIGVDTALGKGKKQNTNIYFNPGDSETGTKPFITISPRLLESPELKKTLVHELQNSVQGKEDLTSPSAYAEGGLVSKNAMSDYFMASSGQMSEMEFVGKHKMSTKEFEDRFESENNVDISGAEDIKEIIGKPKGNDMNRQMSFFNEGGMASPRVDPVSGNEVPIGSRPEEVRDDIDAKLSEGEYVVPADVVRFFGVNFFEQLRNKAKNGLQEMAADDRIGGAPAPQQGAVIAPEDMQAITQMAEGGLVDSTNINGIIDRVVEAAKTNPELQGIFQKRGIMMAEGGLVGDLPSADEAAQSTFDPNQWSTVGANMGGASGSGYGYKQYYSPEGVPMMVLLINGLPAQTIPEGYTTTKPPEVKPSSPVEPRTGQDSPGFSGGATGGSESGSLFNPLGNLDFSDPSSVSKDISKRLSGGTDFSGAGSAVGGLGGALIGGGISAYGKFRDIAVANAALRVAEDKGDLALAEDLAEQIRAAEEDFGLSGLARPEWFDGSQLYEDYQKNQGINPETGEPLKASERAARLAPDAGTGGGARSMAGATARSRQLEEQYGGDTGNRRTVEKDGVGYVQTGGRSDEPDTFSTRVATGSTAPTSSARPQSRPGMNKGGLVARRYKK